MTAPILYEHTDFASPEQTLVDWRRNRAQTRGEQAFRWLIPTGIALTLIFIGAAFAAITAVGP